MHYKIMTYFKAIEAIDSGKSVQREGWGDKFIRLHMPDVEHPTPYVYSSQG
jgi:hypothetical protein